VAQETINIGSAPDDGTGDTLRAAGAKVNSNFDELYAAVAAPAPGGVPVGGIIMWSGAIADIDSPTWELCDGTANAPGPDLRDKFIVGANQDDAGTAKTNLTGSLTTSGGSVSHHHADHSLTTPVGVADHSLTTNVAVSVHALTTDVAVSAHSLGTNVAVADHTLSTNVAISAHTLDTQVAIAAHTLTTNVAIANHATAASAASGTTRQIVIPSSASHAITQPVVSGHVITQPVVAAHSITQPVVSAHVITQPVVNAHTITQPVVGNHAVTQPVVSAHTVTQPVVSAHDTLSAPQPYYALAFIQRMS
jgi:hypothetical protein